MKGIILFNLGSPQSYQPKDVKHFISEMLSDPLVLTVPNWLRPILVKGIIAPWRQFAVSKRYALIWDHKNESSPLLYHTKQLAEKLASDQNCVTEVAMRYGHRSIDDAFAKMELNKHQLSEVVVLPLFPQYTESTYKSAIDAIRTSFDNGKYHFQLRIIEPYYNHPAYIEALAHSMAPYLKDSFDKLVFNYHSLPISHVEAAWEKGIEFDYVFQAKETIRLVLNKLEIVQGKARLAYSSAMFGNWLKPKLTETVKELAKERKKRIVVVSPGFASDNLETLYDISIEAKDEFVNNGGIKFTYIPCLNSSDYWVDAIRKIING